ncbi:MAG: hypothetical protein ACK4ME_02440, partial [Fimbriimonadales bacterium]
MEEDLAMRRDRHSLQSWISRLCATRCKGVGLCAARVLLIECQKFIPFMVLDILMLRRLTKSLL